MIFTIRELGESEYPLLEDFLYHAVFVPEGMEPPPKTIVKAPELRIYVDHFGERRDDRALAAVADGRIVGAVWVRIMDDYGHVDNDTPSFAISLCPEYRGLGIGTALMKEMLALLKRKGYAQASLAVQKANYAVKMYRSLGFVTVDENAEEYIMLNTL